MLEGEVYDEFGTYPKWSIVWMDPNSEHNPKTRERTLILVLWPDGVKVLDVDQGNIDKIRYDKIR